MSSDSFRPTESDHNNIYISTDSDKAIVIEQINSEAAVWRALLANLGIAGIKLVCWYFSKSSAMLSEAMHSGADSFNSLCLLVGVRRGSKPADKLHHFGYGLEANIWALFASLLLMVGSFVSIYTGRERLIHGSIHTLELLNNYHLIAITLIGSMIFEAWAITSASQAVLNEAHISSKNRFDAVIKSFGYINQIKSPTTKFVWFEDVTALAGVIFAFITLTVSKFFVAPALAYIPDAIASIAIGLMLVSLAVYLLKHNINYLTGASAKPQVEEMIKDIASHVSGVAQVQDLKTMDMGTSGLIVNMEIEVDPETQVKDADEIAEKLESRIREKIPNIAHMTIEVQANDTDDNWNEKFSKLIIEGKEQGVLKQREAQMLSNFFDFTNTVVWEVMVPRTEVIFMDADSSIDELIDIIIESGHTRIPIYKENIDDVIGVINAKDILSVLKHPEDKEKMKIEDLVREINIVPENKSISDMLKDFNTNKTQIAAVVDEHGGVAGIVTVEDVIEEIVGEIWDEYDVEIKNVLKIDGNILNVFSKTDIYELNERFGLDLPTEDFQTIGGYVFGLLGREPDVGDEVEANGLKLKVEEMDGHKITRVSLYREDGFVDKLNNEEEKV